MARRSYRSRAKSGLLETVKAGAGVGVGIVGGSALTNKVPFLAQSPIVGSVAELVIASLIAGMGRGDFTKYIAVGMAGHAVVNVVKAVGGPQVNSALGIAGIGAPYASLMPGSNLMPGVAGVTGPKEKIKVTY